MDFLQTLSKMLDFSQSADPDAKRLKAQQLVAAGMSPEGLEAFIYQPGQPTLQGSMPEILAGQQPAPYTGTTQDQFSQMLYGKPSAIVQPSTVANAPQMPMMQPVAMTRTTPPPAPGLKSEQLTALAGLLPKYEAPPLPQVRTGGPSQVQTSTHQLPQRSRVTLADILYGRGR